MDLKEIKRQSLQKKNQPKVVYIRHAAAEQPEFVEFALNATDGASLDMSTVESRFLLMPGAHLTEVDRKDAVVLAEFLQPGASYDVVGYPVAFSLSGSSDSTLSSASSKTSGLCSNRIMAEHQAGWAHPENPSRLLMILKRLKDCGVEARMADIPSREATREELIRVHTESLVDRVLATGYDLHASKPNTRRRSSESAKQTQQQQPQQQQQQQDKKSFGIDNYVNDHTATAAKYAAGCVIACVEQVMENKLKNAFAVVRPPGHHATASEAMGFCFFSNCSVAAQYALDKYPQQVKRVLIFDWDVHHGNGIEDIFYGRNDVLYISTHRYDEGQFYPGTGHLTRVGSGDGAGYNVNIPFDRKADGIGDADFLAVMQHLVMPIAYAFQPDLVLVAAGFDAAKGDPLGHYKVSPAAFGLFTSMLKTLAGGRLVMALEGGYNCDVIAECVESCCKALMGDTTPNKPWGTRVSKEARSTIRKVAKAYYQYWPVLDVLVDEDELAQEYGASGEPLVSAMDRLGLGSSTGPSPSSSSDALSGESSDREPADREEVVPAVAATSNS